MEKIDIKRKKIKKDSTKQIYIQVGNTKLMRREHTKQKNEELEEKINKDTINN